MGEIMKKRLKEILPYILILLLLCSNLYLILRPDEDPADYRITFARVVTNDSSEVSFIDSEPLTDKDEIDAVIFALMHAEVTEPPEVVKAPADTSLWIGSVQSGIAYIQAKLWLYEGKIIYCPIGDDQPIYRVIDAPYYAEQLTKLAQKYTPTGTYSDN